MSEESTEVERVDDSEETSAVTRQQASPPELLSKAVENGANVEVMERLLDMQERWDANQARKAYEHAMAEIRSDLPRIEKKAEVDFTSSKGRTHYKYERLQDVVEAIQPALSEHGLSFRWRTDSTGNDISVTCIISHEQGHSEETTLTAPLDRTGNKNAIQSIGSTVTYLQRYTLKAALGIAAAEDDDGRSAGGSNRKPPQNNTQPKQPKTVSEAQRKKLHAVGKEHYGKGWNSKRHELCENVTQGRTDSSNDLTPSEASTLIDGIQKRIDAEESQQDEYSDDDVRDDEIPTGKEND